MIIKTYQKYIIKNFFTCFAIVLLVFTCLIFILNIFEEVNFLQDKEKNSFYYAVILTLLNIPSLVYEISPFIFLIAAQYFYINIFDNSEIDVMKKFRIDNLKVVTIISSVSFFLGIFIIGAFYNLSAELKHFYYDIKNNLSDENKYLAAVTENGLWLRDHNENYINFINAERLKDNYLENVSITIFTDEFNLVKNIESNKVDITESLWVMKNVSIYENNFPKQEVKQLKFQTNFDKDKLYSLFSNLYSVSIWNLFDFTKDLNLINFSSKPFNRPSSAFRSAISNNSLPAKA